MKILTPIALVLTLTGLLNSAHAADGPGGGDADAACLAKAQQKAHETCSSLRSWKEYNTKFLTWLAGQFTPAEKAKFTSLSDDSFGNLCAKFFQDKPDSPVNFVCGRTEAAKKAYEGKYYGWYDADVPHFDFVYGAPLRVMVTAGNGLDLSADVDLSNGAISQQSRTLEYCDRDENAYAAGMAATGCVSKSYSYSEWHATPAQQAEFDALDGLAQRFMEAYGYFGPQGYVAPATSHAINVVTTPKIEGESGVARDLAIQYSVGPDGHVRVATKPVD